MISFILQDGGADLEISSLAFRIRFAWNPSRHKYFLDLAPGVLSAFLDWCGVDQVKEPLLARLDSALIPRRCVKRIRAADHFVWFFPGDPIRIMLRPVVDVPDVPLAAVPPKPIAFERRSVQLTTEQPCPRCHAHASTFRSLGYAWICGACARSFQPSKVFTASAAATIAG